MDGYDLAALASDLNQGDCSSASPCPGDVNGDEVVDSDDLSIFASELGRTDCPHDEHYYFHNDHLGTPQKITDQSGTIAWGANYKPFGEASITTETITKPFRFPGQYFDPETGLHYNYFRYYDPVIGRYLTPDPIGLRGGIDLFVYGQDNPLAYIDPEGKGIFSTLECLYYSKKIIKYQELCRKELSRMCDADPCECVIKFCKKYGAHQWPSHCMMQCTYEKCPDKKIAIKWLKNCFVAGLSFLNIPRPNR